MCDQHLFKSLAIEIELCLWCLQVTISLNVGTLLTFMKSRAEKLLPWQGIEPTNLDFEAK